jgi:hypothetical protein
VPAKALGSNDSYIRTLRTLHWSLVLVHSHLAIHLRGAPGNVPSQDATLATNQIVKDRDDNLAIAVGLATTSRSRAPPVTIYRCCSLNCDCDHCWPKPLAEWTEADKAEQIPPGLGCLISLWPLCCVQPQISAASVVRGRLGGNTEYTGVPQDCQRGS